MDSELGDVDWLRMDGSCAHGDIYGVLLTSALTMVVDMGGFDERRVGGTTVYFFESGDFSKTVTFFGNFECFRGV